MPGQDDADRLRAALAHDVDLPRRRVRAQDHVRRRRVERVPHVARRVVRRDVEQAEVELVGLDVARAVDLEAHLREDRVDPAQRLRRRVQAAARPRRRPGSVTSMAPAASALLEFRLAQPLGGRLEGRFDGLPRLVGALAERLALVLGQGAQRAHRRHHRRARPRWARRHFSSACRAGHGRQRVEGLSLDLIEVGRHSHVR